MKKLQTSILSLSIVVPAFADASAAQAGNGLFRILYMAFELINRLVPFVISLTVLVFLWGIFKYLTSHGDGDSRKEALGYITWGVVSLFVMVSVWGLVNILVHSFGLDTAMPDLPDVPTFRNN